MLKTHPHDAIFIHGINNYFLRVYVQFQFFTVLLKCNFEVQEHNTLPPINHTCRQL